MAYIWEEYKESNLFKIAYDNVSPYMEVWDKKGEIIFVNIYYRIFELLFPEGFREESDKVDELLSRYMENDRYGDIANLIIHFKAILDLQRGINLQRIIEELEFFSINAGCYGEKLKSNFNKLKRVDQNIILRYLAKYDWNRQKENVFDVVIYSLFHRVDFYYEKSTDIVHLYIADEKNEYNSLLYFVSEYLFKDIKIQVEVIWQNHFGIIGMDDLMRIGELSYV